MSNILSEEIKKEVNPMSVPGSIIESCKTVTVLNEYLIDAHAHEEPTEKLEKALREEVGKLWMELDTFIQNVLELEKENALKEKDNDDDLHK